MTDGLIATRHANGSMQFFETQVNGLAAVFGPYMPATDDDGEDD